jgi:RNA polymerase sigma-70 factor (ECF subfamily)
VDRELVRRAQKGDPGAMAELVGCVGPRLFRLAVRLCGDRSEAEDMVSDTLYRGMAKLKRVREGRAAGAWFSRILVNRWRDRLRRAHRRDMFLEDIREPAAAARDDPVLRAEAADLGERVVRAMAALPPGQRAVLLLHVTEGLTVADIAEALGATSDRVKANLWHARRRMRELLIGSENENSVKPDI